jgi:hypothetical protein
MAARPTEYAVGWFPLALVNAGFVLPRYVPLSCVVLISCLCAVGQASTPSDYDATVVQADRAASPAAEALVMGHHDDGTSLVEQFFE